MVNPESNRPSNDANDDRLFSPSAARNKAAIVETFLKTMPQRGHILEVGGGTGEHGAAIAAAAPGVTLHSGDPDEKARRSIAAWIAASGLANLTGPHAIDVTTSDWSMDHQHYDGLISINMIHIAPFAASEGLFAGAARILKPGGRIFLYGPFSRRGEHTAPSNEAFDASLKARNPTWGVRDIEHDLAPLWDKNALSLADIVEMPANNFTLIVEKKT